MTELALRECWPIAAERITCPVRVVWGTEDRLLPRPSSQSRRKRTAALGWAHP